MRYGFEFEQRVRARVQARVWICVGLGLEWGFRLWLVSGLERGLRLRLRVSELKLKRKESRSEKRKYKVRKEKREGGGKNKVLKVKKTKREREKVRESDNGVLKKAMVRTRPWLAVTVSIFAILSPPAPP